VTRPGSLCETPVLSTDFYPTLLDLAGLSLDPSQHRDGVSLVPLLKGESLDRGPLFWHYPHYGNQGGAPCAAALDGDWKLIEWYEDGRREFYHLSDDPSETHDLAAAQTEKVKALANRLNTWRKDVGAIMPTPNPNWKGKPEAKARAARQGVR
jgi:arylsulfatase A-like enzyme